MQNAVARLLARYRVRRAPGSSIELRVIFNTYLPKEVPIELWRRA
jgi:hypothetical protein